MAVGPTLCPMKNLDEASRMISNISHRKVGESVYENVKILVFFSNLKK